MTCQTRQTRLTSFKRHFIRYQNIRVSPVFFRKNVPERLKLSKKEKGWVHTLGYQKCWLRFRLYTVQSRPSLDRLSPLHICLHLKIHLGSQHHDYNDCDDEVKTVQKQWLSNQVVDFYEEFGIQKLVVRFNKCFNINGNYVEK